ncbi:MAG: sulfotransferase [Roseivirga sp.]
MSLPNFLLVGAAKAGTTSLYYYLNQHPDIFISKLKEPKYFSSQVLDLPHQGIGDFHVDRYRVRDYEEYKKLFEGRTEKMIGESTVEYLYYHDKIKDLIKKELGDVKIIIILRNPVDRAFSAYSNLRRDSRENLSFREALEAEEDRISKNWDMLWAYKKSSLYYEQVKTFNESFSNVLVLNQDDLKNDTPGVIRKAFEFLGVSTDAEIDLGVEHNPSGVPKNVLSRLVLSRSNPVSPYIREMAKFMVPRNVLERYAKKNLSKILLEDADREYLKPQFKEDILKLQEYLGRDFSSWT